MSLLLEEKDMDRVERWVEYTLIQIFNKTKPMDLNCIVYMFKVGKFQIIIDIDDYHNNRIENIRFQYDDHYFLKWGPALEEDQDEEFFQATNTIVKDFLTAKYVFCKYCEKPILEKFGKDLCKECYVNEYEHGEECSICKETGKGHWIQYENCNHIFHFKCHRKLKVKICPLCRGECLPYKNYFGEN